MAAIQATNDAHSPIEAEKENNLVASEFLRDVEFDSAFSIAARRPGSIDHHRLCKCSLNTK
jgi:hypothetical protein